MNATDPDPSHSNHPAPRAERDWVGKPFDFVFVGSCYVGLAVVVALFSIAEPLNYMAFAALSVVLMLRRRRGTRIICLIVLLMMGVGLALYAVRSRWLLP